MPSGSPPGALIRSRNIALHMLCTGSGSPTVLLEAGLGGNYLDWTFVQPELARTTRVCSYDRAGAGWSERSPNPRTTDEIAAELHRIVGVASIDRPFILVGHSFGGMAALRYARLYPKDVAGLVLLDSAHPDQFRRFQDAGVALPSPQAALARTPPTAAAYGLPLQLRGLAISLATTKKARDAAFDETVSLAGSADSLAREDLPRLPSRILIHGNREWDGVYPDGRMERAWRDMQAQLARSIGAPSPIVAASSGHQIPLDAPALVVSTVADLIRSLGTKVIASSPSGASENQNLP
jgi:pimeloyl-ACP methyl ester carboxylesterase